MTIEMQQEVMNVRNDAKVSARLYRKMALILDAGVLNVLKGLKKSFRFKGNIKLYQPWCTGYRDGQNNGYQHTGSYLTHNYGNRKVLGLRCRVPWKLTLK